MMNRASIRLWWLAAALLSALGAPPASGRAEMGVADRLQFADGLFVRGLHDLALKEYLTIVRDEPTNAPLDTAIFRAGECYRHLGRRDMAERFYKRVMAEFPESPHRFLAEFRRAELFVGAAQYADAAGLLRALLAAGPPAEVEASAHYYLGYSLDKLDQRDDAARHLNIVLDRFPESPFCSFACLALAELYRRNPPPPVPLRDLFRRAAEQPASPRVGAEALFQWAEEAYRAGDFEESAEVYARLLKRYPEDARAAEARRPFAWAALEAGRFETALKLAEERLAAGEAEEDWLYLLANSLRQLRKLDEALAAYDRLLEMFPRGARRGAAVYEKALIDFRRGDHAAVLAQAEALRNAPGAEEDGAWLLAESRAARGSIPEAIEAFGELAERFPKSGRAPRALFRRAELQQAAGLFEDASASCLKLAKQYPSDPLAPDALFISAFCLARLGRHQESLRDWQTLLKDYPADPRADLAAYQAAVAQIQLERPQDALKTLERLLKDHPETERAMDARLAIGLIHEQAGRLDEADAALREALACHPKAADAARIQYRLAGVLQKQGREQDAAELIQPLLDSPILNEMPPALLEWLAELQIRQGAPAKALAAAKALADHGDSPAWKQIGWYWTGRSQEAAGRVKPAREAYAKALAVPARTAEAAEAAACLGDLRFEEEALDHAAAAYTEAAERAAEPELMPVRARAYFGLARVAGARGQWEDAARFYMSVAVLFDDPQLAPRALHEAAAAFDRLGRAEESRRVIEELRARYPGSRWAEPSSAPPAGESS